MEGDGVAEHAGLENPEVRTLELREKLRNTASTLKRMVHL
jgi:hypothetical protein